MPDHGFTVDPIRTDAADTNDGDQPGSPFDVSSHEAGKVPKGLDYEPIPIMKSPLVTKAPFILMTELAERLAYYSISTNIIVYITTVMNYPSSKALSTIQAWSGVCYVTPLLGGFVADAYIGRYWSILSFSLAFYLPGLILLMLTAWIPSLHPSSGESPTGGQLTAFWFAMFMIALGTGGIKPNVSSLGADCFDTTKPAEAALLPRYYNYFYACINIGSIVASIFLVYIQENISWALGFGIPAAAFLFAIVIFVIGSPRYRKLPPGGSPWSRMYKVLVGAIAHRKVVVPENDDELYEYGEGTESIIIGQNKIPRTASFKFLEKACTRMEGEADPDHGDDGEETPAVDPVTGKKPQKSKLRTLTEVEEFKCLLRLLPIALSLIMFNAIYAQMSTMFVLQGQGMNTQLGSINVPAATVSSLDSISVVVFVFIYDLLIAPFFIKIGHPISPLQRIGWGYFFSICSMIVAGGLEVARLNQVYAQGLTDVNPNDEGAQVVSMSVWWQSFQYTLVGVSEVFSMVGSLYLFYNEAPDSMRSTSAAIQLVAVGLGSFLSSALVAIIGAIAPNWIPDNINQGHIDYWFFTLAVLMLLNLIVFIFIAKNYRYKHIVHHTVDLEALAMAPDGRAGIPFSHGMISDLSKDLDNGFISLASARSAIANEMSVSYSQYMPSIRKRQSIKDV